MRLAPVDNELCGMGAEIATDLVHDLCVVSEVDSRETVKEDSDILGGHPVVLAPEVVLARVAIGLTLIKKCLAEGSVLRVLARVDLTVSSERVERSPGGHLGRVVLEG